MNDKTMTLDVDDLAQEIRRVDGNHSLGACTLAEALMPFITRHLSQTAERGEAVAFRYRDDVRPRLLWHTTTDASFADLMCQQGHEVEPLYTTPPPAAGVPAGWAMVPEYRGYAHLGIGRYRLFHSHADDVPELCIVPAKPEEVAGRIVGDLRNDGPDVIDADAIAVRLQFENVAGLNALEQQLRLLREVHFPGSLSATPSPAIDVAAVRNSWVSVDESRPVRNEPAIYWHKSERGGFVAIADEWRDEHHLENASHWMPYLRPIGDAK